MGDQRDWDERWKELEPKLDSLLAWIGETPLPEFHQCGLTATAATYLFGAAVMQRAAMGDERPPKVIARELFEMIITTMGMGDDEE